MEKHRLYKRRIIKQLYFANSLSCAQLSVAIKKSLPLTARLLNELIEEGFVTETGFAPSTGGRRAAVYALNPGIQYIVSVAMDQFVTRIGIINMQNGLVTPVEQFDLPLAQNSDALNILSGKIEQHILSSGIDRDKIIGIGIGMPGFVDAKKGSNHSFLKTSGKSITDHISEKTGLPVYIDNDSSLIALAELRLGAARKRKNVMVVNIGWGVGLGMILNGELFRGHNGFAGEFSHISLFSNSKLCSCGKSGCLETETSLLEIIAKAKAELDAGTISRLQYLPLDRFGEAVESLVAAAHAGDKFTVQLFSEAGYNIGRGVAILIHILNPELIILSGRGALAGKVWQAPIQQALNEHCIPRLADNTEIEMSTLGYNAELFGAAVLVMENCEKMTMGKSSVPEAEPAVSFNNP